jgi:hypothetical protein
VNVEAVIREREPLQLVIGPREPARRVQEPVARSVADATPQGAAFAPLPAPWSVEETDACFIVRDANGQARAPSRLR